jgi:DNA-binding NarL/FixJ family response regulator
MIRLVLALAAAAVLAGCGEEAPADNPVEPTEQNVVELDGVRYAGAIGALIRDYLAREPGETGGDELTPRETEVVKLIAEGHTSREIASVSISEHTVERHRANALEKLHPKDGVALTRYAIRRGLVEP